MKHIKWLLSVFFLFFLFSGIFAQGWVKTYPSQASNSVTAHYVERTSDGGFILGGKDGSGHIIKTDLNGNTLWQRSFPTGEIQEIEQTNDGGYIMATNLQSNSRPYVAKLDANGQTSWTWELNQFQYGLRSIKETPDSNYIAVGRVNLSNNDDLFIVKLNPLGDTIWTKIIADVGDVGFSERAEDVIIAHDSTYILTGFHVSNQTSRGMLVNLDTNGTLLWTTVLPMTTGYEVQKTSNSGYVIAGSSSFISKCDASGNLLWTQSYQSIYSYPCKSVRETFEGGYLLACSRYLFKTDSLGNLLWSKDSGGNQTALALATTTDSKYVVAGTHNVGNGFRLMKIDSNGNTSTNLILGNIFHDTNANCILDSLNDIKQSGVLLKIQKLSTGDNHYITTDNNGFYSILVDSGKYLVNIDTAPLYYQFPCHLTQDTVTFNGSYLKDTLNFALDPAILCPLLRVDLSAPFIRPTGGGSHYTVSYCNHGTTDAINAYVEVSLDPFLTILGSSIPIANQNGNVYTFNIDTIGIGQCNSFTINIIADSAALIGQTICSEAHIYPDSICIPNYWNGPILTSSAECINDSIYFRLENIGVGMIQPHDYYVYEDNIIFKIGTTNILGSGNSQQIIEAANPGKTYRIIAKQADGFPPLLGDSVTTAAIEGCHPFLDGSFNTGFITQFSNGNSSPFIAVDCQELIAAYDPNDKSAQPIGYDSAHYIFDYTALDYKVRFQNTGNDTAFLVVIRDTLSPHLDLSTIEMGASSHPYTWRIYGQGILEVKFSNILLPDSSTNEPASNGFFRFRIQQTTSNPLGTVIHNSAAIYFDYNPPIITNQTWHTIGDNFVPIYLTTIQQYKADLDVFVYPNPFKQSTTIKVEGQHFEQLQLSIFNTTGQLMQHISKENTNRIQLHRNHLPTGIYFYHLEGNGQRISTGKIIAQ